MSIGDLLKNVDERKINEIRGKMLVGHASIEELQTFLNYTVVLESLVEDASNDDFYGTEGWKHHIGWDE